MKRAIKLILLSTVFCFALSSLLLALAASPAQAWVPGYVYSTDGETPVRDSDGHCVRTATGNGKPYAITECNSESTPAPKATAPAPEAAPAPKRAPAPAPTPAQTATVPAVPADSDRDGVPDTADKCADTPSGVKVDATGCPVDSDHDGVADYMDKCPGSPRGSKVDAQGCVLSVTLKINFDSGHAVVKNEYLSELEQFAQYLQQYPDQRAEIQGHTDNLGNPKKNQSLSEERAKAVREVLVSKFGIAGDRLTAKGYGQTKPVTSNKEPAGRETNRRVEAVISK